MALLSQFCLRSAIWLGLRHDKKIVRLDVANTRIFWRVLRCQTLEITLGGYVCACA